MKTLMLYWDGSDDLTPKFIELDGDYSRLNNIYINGYLDMDDDNPAGRAKRDHHQSLQDELSNLVLDARTGRIKLPILNQPTKDWDFFIHCGFLP